MLTGLIFLPLLFLPTFLFLKKELHIKTMALFYAIIHCIYFCGVFYQFDKSKSGFQFLEKYKIFEPLGLTYSVGIDGFSLLLCGMIILFLPLIILAYWNSFPKRAKIYFINLYLIQIAALGSFLSLDLFAFYMFFEFSLIPLVFIIGIWAQKQKVQAAFRALLYNAVGSVFLLGAIATLVLLYKSVNGAPSAHLLDLETLQLSFVNKTLFSTQTILFLGFVFAFCVRMGLFPMHGWLTETQDYAPAAGSVCLFVVALNTGAYGFFRFVPRLFPLAFENYAEILCWFAFVSIFYGSLVAYHQESIKKALAYISLSYGGFFLLGLSSLKEPGTIGAAFHILSYGVSGGALILMVHMIFERLQSQEGSFLGAPNFRIFLFIFCLSSIALPGMAGFSAKILILWGLFTKNILYGVFGLLSLVLIFLFFFKIFKGQFIETHAKEQKSRDLCVREWASLIPLALLIFWMGIYPHTITHFLNPQNTSQEAYHAE